MDDAGSVPSPAASVPVMAHLDLDTSDLAAAARQAGRAADALEAVAHDPVTAGGGPAEARAAAGDPVLAAAVTDLLDAWRPAHRDLVATLAGLADRLGAASTAFEQAEVAAVERLARAVTGDGS
ncbi:hypothetical protein GCM10023216_10490 [Isoptericola chiayiensis]|uniref:Uncharacterized protein n=2 Tax=Isoptericola chiayiensis TaxID=579446 RepID=A0ABP8YAC9_9MICO